MTENNFTALLPTLISRRSSPNLSTSWEAFSPSIVSTHQHAAHPRRLPFSRPGRPPPRRSPLLLRQWRQDPHPARVPALVRDGLRGEDVRPGGVQVWQSRHPGARLLLAPRFIAQDDLRKRGLGRQRLLLQYLWSRYRATGRHQRCCRLGSPRLSLLLLLLLLLEEAEEPGG